MRIHTTLLGLLGTAVLAAPAEATQSVKVAVTGRISISVDGAGHRTLGTSTINVLKPNDLASVRSAHMACADVPYLVPLANGNVTLDTTSITFDELLPFSSGGFDWMNGFVDVTAIVKPIVDPAAAGPVALTYSDTPNVDGCGLWVIFDDPAVLEDRTMLIFFGGQATAGDDFAVSLAEPLGAGDAAEMGLAIAFSFQGGGPPSHACTGGQFSTIDVNGARLASCSGNFDDADPSETGGDGNLITVGGNAGGDTTDNPVDPFSQSTGTDDELYNLASFLGPADTLISIHTTNPSNNDDIFAGHIFVTVAAVEGEGILLTPASATNPVGSTHVVTAKVTDNLGVGVPGKDVTFTVISGPNAGETAVVTTVADGTAQFSYLGDSGVGTDTIQASFIDSTSTLRTSNLVTKEWVAGAFCGDGIINVLGEQCDGADAPECPGLCQVDCTCAVVSVCGNDVTEGAEACDGTDDAACPGLCQGDCTCGVPPPVCGDGVVNQISEECDGADDGACPGLCEAATCTCSASICPPGYNPIFGTPGDDQIFGTGGDDCIYGYEGNDLIYGEAGNDLIFGGGGDDTLYGNGGNDEIYGEGGKDKIDGGRNDDKLSGGDGNDLMYGQSGNDVVDGDAGDDALYGHSGNDTLSGGDHNDRVFGGDGNDTCSGGAGTDKLGGGAGDDALDGNSGSNNLDGGAGLDSCINGPTMLACE
ncbi:MAG: hypothetical protein HY791_19440 [Deltaproteobacteria bacterium]|nr:hypothetical protein [Deltaproteobacteria bacterium]